MKHYLALGLLSTLLLTSCSVDLNDAKDKKIGELEKQVTEMKKEKEEAKQNTVSLDVQDKCSKKAKEVFIEQYTDTKDVSYENHYNNKLNKCFVEIYYMKTSWDIIWTYKSIYDAYEGKTYADYAWHTVKDKKYWEVKPIVCQIWDWYCSTTEEFDSAIKEYMEN